VTRAVALLCLGVVVALAGCGSSGPPRLSQSEYQRRAGQICSDYHARIRALGQPDKLTEVAPYIAKALPILSVAVDRLGRVRPPSDLADPYARYLEALRETRTRDLDLRNAAASADGATVQGLLADAARAGPATDRLARAAKLAACVQG